MVNPSGGHNQPGVQARPIPGDFEGGARHPSEGPFARRSADRRAESDVAPECLLRLGKGNRPHQASNEGRQH
jgi:hypothetical protein